MSTTPTEQPEALRLADALDALDELDAIFTHRGMCGEAAAELRRQHSEIDRLTAELERQRAARIEAQVDNEALKSKPARSGLERHKAVREAVSEAVAAEREACEERVVSLFEVLETPYLPDITRAIRALGTP